MAEKSPQAGRYELTVRSWRKPNKEGGYTTYHLGDVVELNEAEAARLAGAKNLKPVKQQSQSQSETTTTASRERERESK